MPKPEALATAPARWSPSVACIWSLDTNACTAPERVKPRTRAHSVSQNMKNASRRLRPTSATVMNPATRAFTIGPGGRSRRTPRPACVGLVTTGVDGVAHAVGHVLVEQRQGHGLQGPGGGRDLVEHVDAVLVLVDHALQSPAPDPRSAAAASGRRPCPLHSPACPSCAPHLVRPLYPSRVSARRQDGDTDVNRRGRTRSSGPRPSGRRWRRRPGSASRHRPGGIAPSAPASQPVTVAQRPQHGRRAVDVGQGAVAHVADGQRQEAVG